MNTRHPNGPPNGYADGVAQFSIRIPDDLRDRIDTAAKRQGLTRTTWLCLAAERVLAGDFRSEDVRRLEELERRLAAVEIDR